MFLARNKEFSRQIYIKLQMVKIFNSGLIVYNSAQVQFEESEFSMNTESFEKAADVGSFLKTFFDGPRFPAQPGPFGPR